MIQDDNRQDTEQESNDKNQEHDTCKEQLDQAEQKYKRALADYQNLEKRVREERTDLIRSANRELLLRLLPVLDTLQLAEKHNSSQDLKVCITLFLDTLKTEGVERVKTEKEQFDPHTMEVVTTAEGKDGVVIQEVRAGYLLYDKLLRPAQVIVGNGESKQEAKEK